MMLIETKEQILPKLYELAAAIYAATCCLIQANRGNGCSFLKFVYCGFCTRGPGPRHKLPSVCGTGVQRLLHEGCKDAEVCVSCAPFQKRIFVTFTDNGGV